MNNRAFEEAEHLILSLGNGVLMTFLGTCRLFVVDSAPADAKAPGARSLKVTDFSQMTMSMNPIGSSLTDIDFPPSVDVYRRGSVEFVAHAPLTTRIP